jgi:NADPH2:quinone reductase
MRTDAEQTMRAWRVHELGEPEQVMSLDEIPVPEPGPGQSLVRVAAAGLNFPDLLVCRGDYQERPALPFTPGLEVAGTAVGGPRAGERVAAIASLPAGGLAEYVVVADGDLYPVPPLMPSTEAAVLLGTYLTSQVGLIRRAGLRAGETVLVHAGAGGVGSAAIQLAKAANAHVIATAGGPAKTEICRQLGADVVIDYDAEDFVEIVKQATDGRGADVVYDPATSSTPAGAASRSRAGSWSSGSPGAGSPRRRRTTPWSRTTAWSGCTSGSTGSATPACCGRRTASWSGSGTAGWSTP